jgi:hypothetical protein
LPLFINTRDYVVPAALFRFTCSSGPIHVATKLTDDYGVTLIAQVAKMLFPTGFQNRIIDNDTAVGIPCRFSFEAGTGCL